MGGRCESILLVQPRCNIWYTFGEGPCAYWEIMAVEFEIPIWSPLAILALSWS